MVEEELLNGTMVTSARNIKIMRGLSAYIINHAGSSVTITSWIKQ